MGVVRRVLSGGSASEDKAKHGAAKYPRAVDARLERDCVADAHVAGDGDRERVTGDGDARGEGYSGASPSSSIHRGGVVRLRR